MVASPMALRSRVLARVVSSSVRRSLLGAHPQPAPSLLAAAPRPSATHRLPSVCGGLLTLMPLHSAVASARLRSAISPESQSWGLVPQVETLCLYDNILSPY
ncbi:hypothetical protein ACP70R_027044 [Stipagrostis hirtigluma subsp. patula]